MTDVQTYDVYEEECGKENYIGCVQAVSEEMAIEAAHRKYGAPVVVKLND